MEINELLNIYDNFSKRVLDLWRLLWRRKKKRTHSRIRNWNIKRRILEWSKNEF